MANSAEPPERSASSDHQDRSGSKPPSNWWHLLWLLALGITVAVFLAVPSLHTSAATENLTYSGFLTQVDAHHVKTASIASDGMTTGTLANGDNYTTTIPTALAGSALLDKLEAAKVDITATSSSSSGLGSTLLTWLVILLPLLLLGWLWVRASRRSGGGMFQGALNVGRSRAKVFDAEQPKTTFSDVAGYQSVKSEILEVVDFLQQPQRYKQAGAAAPRGVLMVGPPGTGKTLLARAVAGQAGVPFFSVAGSSFVEMFVGVGAARVRDLFEEARRRAPAIVFVDEIDAIGGKRGGPGIIASNDEREQTLNQLLSEMDGFDQSTGIVVLAATNRPDVLDPALLRPGRFDRQVVIPLPNMEERQAIVTVHCRDKRLGSDVRLDEVARGTPGFSGADLANLANEAAICAVREGRDVLSAADFDQARDRIVLGRSEGSNVLLPEEKYAVAVHEAGHALVAAVCEHADPVAKVTILPAGQSLGATHQLPVVERHLYGENYLRDSLTVRLAGRAAEILELGQGSTGAANDLTEATELATKMVREFGLSETIGPVGYPNAGSVYLGGPSRELSSRPFAEATQATIDAEVSSLLRQAEERAHTLLKDHVDALRALVQLLLSHETVDGSIVYSLVRREEPSGVIGETMSPHRSTRKNSHRL